MLSPQKLQSLRDLMKREGVDAYVVPTADAHDSEYVAARDKRRAFLTGFTGSAGTALVTNSSALLWTDGRYFVQAEEELRGSEWKLMKAGLPATPTLSNVLQSDPEITRIGFDSKLMSIDQYQELTKLLRHLPKEKRRDIIFPCRNFVDEIWGSSRPSAPHGVVLPHPVEFSGVCASAKLAKLRTQMKGGTGPPECPAPEVESLIVSALDEIAWLFNLRGSDIEFNPVFLSYAHISQDFARLYVDVSRFSISAVESLALEGIDIRPYESMAEDLETFTRNSAFEGERVWLDPRTNVCLYNCVTNPKIYTRVAMSPIKILKAKKNDVELKGMIECHIRDGKALCSFFAKVDKMKIDGSLYSETESSLSLRLDTMRAKGKLFKGLSFETISAFGANAAMCHYRADPESCSTIGKGIYLVDSGAHYEDGTTDVTRTAHFGEPSKLECEAYTAVLKGHIAMSRAVFPEGTRGPQLDCMARQYLWDMKMDYKHGTGHGVGSFLNVHEGPIGVSSSLKGSAAENPLEEGMVISNEPGFYFDGYFGIRIENMVYIKEDDTPNIDEGLSGKFLRFVDLTMAPYAREMILLEKLTDTERQHVDSYHQKVQSNLLALMEDEYEKAWLLKATQPLDSRMRDS